MRKWFRYDCASVNALDSLPVREIFYLKQVCWVPNSVFSVTTFWFYGAEYSVDDLHTFDDLGFPSSESKISF